MAPRTYLVPRSHQGDVLPAAATLDQVDLAASLGDPWARHFRAKENTRLLASILGEDRRLPVGVMDGDMIVGLWRDGMTWSGSWVAAGTPAESELLDADTVAFVARSLEEGHPVVTVPYTPLAVLSANGGSNRGITAAPTAPAAPDSAGDLPAKAKVLAVVDQYDRNAVMDVVVVLPGPKVMRRHAGEWRDDPTWVSVLRSVRPPPVVLLEPDQIDAVLTQIDESTRDMPFDETEKEEAGKPVAASAWTDRADDMAIEWVLTATISPALDKYWLAGPGAAKIRWGTPGAWRRCHRNLSKYVGIHRAKGLCTNLSQRLGGHGVATHVGD